MTILAFLAAWQTWVLAATIGLAGDIIKSFILTSKYRKEDGGYHGWRGVYFMTYKAHPLPVGVLAALGLSLIGVSIHESLSGWADHALWGLGVGFVSSAGYAAIPGVIKSIIEQYGKAKPR